MTGLRGVVRLLRGRARRLASRDRAVWQGVLITAGLALFRGLHRGLDVGRSGFRMVGLPRPSVEGFDTAGELLPADAAVQSDPIARDGCTSPAADTRPDFASVSWRLYRDVLLPVGNSARRTAWFSGLDLFIEESEMEVFDYRNFANHLDLVAASRSGALARRHEAGRSIGTMIYPGSFAPGNWYHWITEILPRIWLTRRLPTDLDGVPLLIHPGFLQFPAMRETLDVIRGDRPVITVDDVEWLHIDRMVWVDGMFSMNHHAIYPDGLVNQSSRFHPAMRDFRADVLAARRRVSGGTPRRVFLDRGGHARPYNDTEAKEALASRGFVVVDPGSLDFSGQVELFANAEFLVGPSGAAWANLLFASQGTKALYWTPSYFAGTQTWASLGALSGAAVHEHTYSQAFGAFKYGSYELDVPDLLDHVDRVLGDDA